MQRTIHFIGKRGLCSSLGILLIVGTSVSAARADWKKTLWYRNFSAAAASRSQVDTQYTVNDTRGISPGRQAFATEVFNDSNGLGTSRVEFSAGALGAGLWDTYQAEGPGTLRRTASIIRQVELWSAAGPSLGKVSGRALSGNVAGFTNHEEFDFSDRENGVFRMDNNSHESDTPVKYVFSNFRLYKNLPIERFGSDQWMNATFDDLVVEISSLEIKPGEAFPGSMWPSDLGELGPVADGTYALATAESMQIVHNVTNEILGSFSSPMGAAVTVPEPASLGLLTLAGVIGLLRRR